MLSYAETETLEIGYTKPIIYLLASGTADVLIWPIFLESSINTIKEFSVCEYFCENVSVICKTLEKLEESDEIM